MDPSPADDPQEEESDIWAWFALPWVVSSAVHAAILLIIALSWSPSAPPQAAAGPALRVHAVTEDGGDPNAAAGPEGLNFSTGGSGTKYFDDDPGVASDRPAQDQQPGGSSAVAGATGDGAADRTAETTAAEFSADSAAGGSGLSVEGALAAVTSERPPASFAGLLPGPPGNAATGTGAAGRGDGAVGDAAGLTSGTAPSNRLGKGGYASTSVFGVGGQGYKFVYVFDRSGSMGSHGGATISNAKSQLLKSLADLGGTHQFQIIFYNDHPAVFNATGVAGRLTFANDQNKASAESFVRSIIADGSTDHEEALHLALRMHPDVIFFLTDADDPRLNSDQLARIQSLNQGTCINCIEFGYGAQEDPDNFLVKLARQNYGKHVYVDTSRLKVIH